MMKDDNDLPPSLPPDPRKFKVDMISVDVGWATRFVINIELAGGTGGGGGRQSPEVSMGEYT